MSPEQQQQIAAVQQIVCQRMADQQAGHGVDHVLRVLRTARELQSQVGGDRYVIELAALLHDIGDAKFHDGVERSGEFSRQILVAQGVDRTTIAHVAEIADTISFRKQTDRKTLSIEAQIVQDADRLDALGAIGIVRTIEYGAAKGQPFYLADDKHSDQPTGIGHFHDKLFRLTELMNTDAARKIARQREAFMKTFVQQYLFESNAESASR